VNNETLIQAVREQLNGTGFSPDIELLPVSGGGNNRAHEVRSGDRSLFLKEYFQHPNDRRDRLGAEYAFTRFAWDRGLRCIPQPFAMNRSHGFALYEFIRGRKITPEEVQADAVAQAARFFSRLNEFVNDPDAQQLPRASESCFTVEDHLACVDRRVSRLDRIAETSVIDREAGRFIREELRPIWDRLGASIRQQCASGETAREAVPCLSPSDFGFHNALLEPSGQFRFIDFEYAGLDDPAKMVCDFFCQVAVPAPADSAAEFMKRTIDGLRDAETCRQRIKLLMPAYQIKWCCIILNDFLPTDSARRKFAGQGSDEETRKRMQLDKAIHKFAALDNGGILLP